MYSDLTYLWEKKGLHASAAVTLLLRHYQQGAKNWGRHMGWLGRGITAPKLWAEMPPVPTPPSEAALTHGISQAACHELQHCSDALFVTQPGAGHADAFSPRVQPAPQGLVTPMSAKSIKSQSEHSVLKSEGMGWEALEEKLFSTCQAEEAPGLQSPCLFHHSSSNLAQPLCTSLQLSLSGSCCKIWLLKERRGAGRKPPSNPLQTSGLCNCLLIARVLHGAHVA